MRYPTSILLFKYLHYYWVGANSKGHGVHSPFVFSLIQEQFNATIPSTVVEQSSPAIKNLMQEISNASAHTLPRKITHLMARLFDRFRPVNNCVFAGANPSTASKELDSIDFAYLGVQLSNSDLLEAAEWSLKKMHSTSWMIVEGIHSSSEREAIWSILKQHATTRLTIDLFFIGLLFCRKEQKEQEHFIIRY